MLKNMLKKKVKKQDQGVVMPSEPSEVEEPTKEVEEFVEQPQEVEVPSEEIENTTDYEKFITSHNQALLDHEQRIQQIESILLRIRGAI